MLVEAAWAAAKAPGPLHAFFVRIRARRGHQVAAVAMARKLAVLVLAPADQGGRLSLGATGPGGAARSGPWSCRPAGRRRRATSAAPTYAYNVKELRDREKAIAEQAERAYEHFVASWRPKPGKKRTGAASAAGSSTMRRPGGARSRRPALRHAVARARPP